MSRHLIFVSLAAAPLLAGCTTTDTAYRYDGVSLAAGNAIAANTVMQMVDPWPAGVEQTDLRIPADHDQYRRQTVEAEADSDDGSIVSE